MYTYVYVHQPLMCSQCSAVPRFDQSSETTAFVNMANAKLKLSAITRETVVDSASVLNVLVGENLTLNKLRGLSCFCFFLNW